MEHTKKLAVLLALSVAAFGSTARAADYTAPITGSGDSYDSSIKKVDGSGNYTYTFNEGDTLQIETTDAPGKEIYGVSLGKDNPSSIIIENLSGINVQYEANTGQGLPITAAGVSFEDGFKGRSLSLGDTGLTVSASNAGSGRAAAYGIYLTENNGKDTEGQISMGNGTIHVEAAAQGRASATGVEAHGCTGSVTLGTGNIIAAADASAGSSSANAYGIRLYAGQGAGDQNTTRLIKSGGTIQAQVKGNEKMGAYGVSVSDSNTIELQNVRIHASAEGNGKNRGSISGIFTSSGGAVSMTGGEITVSAEKMGTEGVDVYAVDNMSGTIRLGQNADGQATGQKLIINGDVWNETDASTTGISLRTAESALNGSVYRMGGTVDMELANGAVWNNGTGYNKSIASNVTTLAMAGGVVNQLSAQNMTIQNYSGTGDFRFQADGTAQDGVLSFTKNGTVTIGSAAAGSVANLSVSNTTVNTLDAAKAEESLNALAYRMIYTNAASEGHVTGKVTLAEGLITPETSGELHFYEDGENEGHGYVTNGTGGPQETATMSAMKHIAAVSILAWRQEDSTFSQRLGDLRRSAGGQGLWARMSRGEFKYDGEYKNQYDFYQLGYDRASGAWHYGAAFSYNDGETSYRAGCGENSSASLSLYGTWLGDKGHYADIVLKGGKLSNEYTITTAAGRTHGDYDLWGVSLSGEYGREIALADGWFVTPQAQMTLLHIGSEDYTTSNGIRVSQESLDSAVGRVGLEAGKRFGAGRVYGKFSLLHDFAGSADTWLRYEGLENSYREDMGDTWCEAGFGVNLRLTDSTYFYVDVARTFGGDVETPWQWNAGVRWGF